MKILKFLQNPHFQLIAGLTIGFAAIILVHDFVVRYPDFSTKWRSVVGVTLFICLVVSAYTYLVIGRYDKKHWDKKFVWSIGAIKILSAITLILMMIATYVAFMASGYQLGGLLVPWMEIFIIMLAIIPIPAASYWAMVNLQQTFNKRYAWISLYIYFIPLAIALSLAYSGGWLQEFYLWLRMYLGI